MQALLDAPTEETFGRRVCEAAGLTSASVYVILRRLRDEGLLTWRWEDREEAAAEGRPPRRYYRLTPEGRRVANLETVQTRTGLRQLMPGWRTA
jgi:PadR family transcriptional regulator, regulatory protein PadR